MVVFLNKSESDQGEGRRYFTPHCNRAVGACVPHPSAFAVEQSKHGFAA
jgi:hypothetical protein